MEECLGKRYVLVTQENFEDFLVFIGKGFIARKAALVLKQEVCLTKEPDGRYTFTFTSALATSSVTFKLGEEFEEIRADGVKVKSVIRIEGNKMTHVQTDESGRTLGHIREFYPDKLIVTTTADHFDKVTTRIYESVP